MAKGTKTIKIGDYDINIIQFNALKAFALRGEIVRIITKKLNNSDLAIEGNSANILTIIAGVIYDIPIDFLLKLFENCSALDIGGLNDEANFNKVFSNNIDGIIELATEVIQFNGFFSLDIISKLAKKIPLLSPMEEALNQLTQNSQQN